MVRQDFLGSPSASFKSDKIEIGSDPNLTRTLFKVLELLLLLRDSTGRDEIA